MCIYTVYNIYSNQNESESNEDKDVFSCLECLLNQSDKSKSRVSESLIWLAEEGSAFHSPLQIWNQWENRAKTASAKTQKYISGYLGNILTYTQKKSFRQLQHLNFSPHILVLHGQSVLQFLIQLFSLAKRCAQAWNTFGCIWAKQQCQKCKCGKMEVRRIQIIFILPSHKVAVSQYMNYTYKKLQIFFLTLAILCTLSQILPCACKSFRHHFIFILEEDWRGTESSPVWSFCSLWWFGVLWRPLCFIKSKVNAAVYQEILENFVLPSADKLYGDADFLFQQDFSTCPQLTMILLCLIGQPICLIWTPYGIYGIL